jgi:hypothetical protein
MTRQILLTQLARAREIGDRAAVTMLLARIKREAAADTAAALSARPGGLAGRVGPTGPLSGAGVALEVGGPVMSRRDPAQWAAYMREWKRKNPQRQHEIAVRTDQTEAGRERQRRAKRAWKLRNVDRVREQARVRMLVVRAIKTGVIVKAPCVVCGVDPAHAHHHNGHGPGHELEVTWLCPLHHSDAHGRTGLWRRAAA